MGNNAAFTTFEATVLATYDKGVLDKDLLSSFMTIYRGCDIDRGGMTGELSKDGLDIDDIILKVFKVKSPAKPKLPLDYACWTEAQQDANEEYQEKRSAAVSKIEDRFGWV